MNYECIGIENPSEPSAIQIPLVYGQLVLPISHNNISYLPFTHINILNAGSLKKKTKQLHMGNITLFV